MDAISFCDKLLKHLEARKEERRDKYRKLKEHDHFVDNAGRESEILAMINVVTEERKRLMRQETGAEPEDGED